MCVSREIGGEKEENSGVNIKVKNHLLYEVNKQKLLSEKVFKNPGVLEQWCMHILPKFRVLRQNEKMRPSWIPFFI